MNDGGDLNDWCCCWHSFVCITDERIVGSWDCPDAKSIYWDGWSDVKGYREAIKAFGWLGPRNSDREVCFGLVKSWYGLRNFPE